MAEREKAIIRVVLNRNEVMVIMTRKNMSHSEVANRIGISKNHWSRLVWGDACAGPEVRAKIQKVFHNASWSRIFIPMVDEEGR